MEHRLRAGRGRPGRHPPRPPAGTSRTRSPTCSGRTRSRSSPRRTGRCGTSSSCRRSATRTGTSTPPRTRWPGSLRRRCWPDGVPPGRRSDMRCGTSPRARRSPGSDLRWRRRRWRPRGSWRPGRTAWTSTTRSASTRSPPTGSATSPTSASALATTRSPSTSSTRRPRSSASSSRRRRARRGRGARRTPGRRVTGSAYDFCQLVTQRIHLEDTDLVAVGEDADAVALDRAGVRGTLR